MPTMNYVRRSLSDRLLLKLNHVPQTGCWEWQGSRNEFGHGSLSDGNLSGKGWRLIKAHRASWEIAFGKIPAGLIVCHKCDNPPCCNPSHLFLGTKADNSADMVAKGRSKRGNLRPQAKLTADDVRAIRASVEKQAVLAARYGVRQSHISSIRSHHAWPWLD